MIRLVLAVALSAAILGVSLPAIDDARRDRTAARMDRTADRVSDAATSLLHDDPVRNRSLAPGRTVRLALPGRSWTTSRVESVWIDGRGTDRPAVVGYDLPGRRPVSHRLDVPVETDGLLVMRGRGVHRLRLTFLVRQGRPVIVVRRA